VARRYGVSLRAVQHWVERAETGPLREVDWSDRSHAPHRPAHETEPAVVRRIVEMRQQLQHSALG
jgi:transposase